MPDYIMNNSFNDSSCVFPLILNEYSLECGGSDIGVRVADRLVHSSSTLSEGEYIGLQISFNSDHTFKGNVFTSKGANADPDDFCWILKDFAQADSSDIDSFSDFGVNRNIYALKPVPKTSESEVPNLNASSTYYDRDDYSEAMEMSNMLVADM